MQQEWSTAVAVATGELNAQEAFIGGQILLFGDQQKLLDAQPVFGALDAVFASRARTNDATSRRAARVAPMPEMPEIQAHAERLTAEFARPRADEVHAVQLHGTEDRRPRARTTAYGQALRGRRPSRQVPDPRLR